MKASLIYFDEGKDAQFLKWGKNWERWFASFGVLVGLHLLYFFINRKRFKTKIGSRTKLNPVAFFIAAVFPLVWLASAVGCVNETEDEKSSVVYSTFVGIVVYFAVMSVLYLFASWGVLWSIIDFIFGIGATTLAGYTAYKVN